MVSLVHLPGEFRVPVSPSQGETGPSGPPGPTGARGAPVSTEDPDKISAQPFPPTCFLAQPQTPSLHSICPSPSLMLRHLSKVFFFFFFF